MGQIIKQTYRLYNTVGLIDKAKNIYYVPHQDVLFAEKTQALTKVSEVYYKLFNTVCPFSSKYNDIEFSQWSPEDRELKIEGIIDDFRQSRGLGLALNYIIIKREIYNELNGVETLAERYYYAMFIDSVKQAGSRSVTLNLSPDYFTNFFYLNNTETLTLQYDPFNDSMVNTYVERQHYDRFEFLYREYNTGFDPEVKSLQDDLEAGRFYKIDNTPRPTVNNLKTEMLLCKKNGINYDGIKVTICNQDMSIFKSFDCFRIYIYLTLSDGYYKINYLLCNSGGGHVEQIYVNDETYYNKIFLISINEDNLTFTYDTSTNPAGEYVLQNVLTKYLTRTYKPINQEKMLFNEESFRFKYQYRDKRILLPLGIRDIDSNMVEEMIESIRDISTKEQLDNLIASLDTSNKKKCFMALITRYAVIQFKEPVFNPYKVSTIIRQVGDDDVRDYLTACIGNCVDKDSIIESQVSTMVIPILDSSMFPNINEDWLNYGIKLSFNNFLQEGFPIVEDIRFTINKDYKSYGFKKYIFVGGDFGVQQYLLSISLVKHNPLVKRFFDIDYDSEEDTYRLLIDIGNIMEHCDTNGLAYSDWNGWNTMRKLYPYYVRKTPLLTFLPTSGTLLGYTSIGTQYPESIEYLFRAVLDFSHNVTITISSILTHEIFGFIIGDYGYEDQSINLKEDEIDLNTYREPLLDSNPYNFYSISLYENETPFKKERYYQSLIVESNGKLKYTVNARFVQSFAETYKVGVVPIYTVNNKTTLYFSEALVLTLPAGLTIVSDSYMEFYYQNKAQMKNQYAVNDINYEYAKSEELIRGIGNMGKGLVNATLGFGTGGVSGGAKGLGQTIGAGLDLAVNEANLALEHAKTDRIISETQQAKLADMGAKPNTVKLAGSDVVYEASLGEMGIYLNHYTIDDLSYNTIAKILERTGYKVDIMDNLNPFSRVGLDYIKLVSFDFVEDNYVLSQEQMEAIAEIFTAGVTLLHDKDYLHNLGEDGYHNIEKALS